MEKGGSKFTFFCWHIYNNLANQRFQFVPTSSSRLRLCVCTLKNKYFILKTYIQYKGIESNWLYLKQIIKSCIKEICLNIWVLFISYRTIFLDEIRIFLGENPFSIFWIFQMKCFYPLLMDKEKPQGWHLT